MFPFPLKLTTYIASFNQESWITIALRYPDFCKYAHTDTGRRQFLDLFTDIIVTSEKTTYSVFGKLHRLPSCDKPSVIQSNGTQRWYKNVELHCDDNKPAVIRKIATILDM